MFQQGSEALMIRSESNPVMLSVTVTINSSLNQRDASGHAERPTRMEFTDSPNLLAGKGEGIISGMLASSSHNFRTFMDERRRLFVEEQLIFQRYTEL
jgi:hypothetical protein